MPSYVLMHIIILYREIAYLYRGTLYRRLKDFTSAIEDLMLAVELSNDEAKDIDGESPKESKDLDQDAYNQLVLTYNDFAVHCFNQGFYSEATMLFNKAIQEQSDESGLFINRGGTSGGLDTASLVFIHCGIG